VLGLTTSIQAQLNNKRRSDDVQDVNQQTQTDVWSKRRGKLITTIHSTDTSHLSISTSRTITIALCNSLLVGLPAKLLNRLQAVINTSAYLVCYAKKADHITPVLKDLHLLRIQERIQYKLCVLTFKCQHSLAPPYLSDQLQQVTGMEPRQHLRSSSSPALVVPATRRSSPGNQPFLVGAARAWNSLLSTVIALSTLHSFRRALKTHLFAASFPPS